MRPRLHEVYARWLMAVDITAGLGCIQYVSPPTQPLPRARLATAEQLYRDARDLYFQRYVTEALGTGRSDRGVTLEQLRGSYFALRDRALERLEELDDTAFGDEDRLAIGSMRRELSADTTQADAPRGEASCPVVVAQGITSERLTAQVRSCYGRAASHVVTPEGSTDRLTVLSRLASDTSSARRRALFRSLRPVWESVNGRNETTSPWRALNGKRASQWRSAGVPVAATARAFGLSADQVEPMLVALLSAWRVATPDALVEPWDWYFANGGASRRLSGRIAVRDLERLNESYYSSLGASPRDLGIRYDLVPREGKTAVAFTQFGGVPRQSREGPRGAQPWVFATYREGGLGNLVELLHETGHAIHIAAIDTRPAFADWPDSDPFTEGLADVPALEAYDGTWQRTHLGDSASRRDNLREKYGGVMMDVAWALFELRMHADATRDPDAVWTEITSHYLHIAPHPEWSWWAMRGQLIESPGYMLNYALGAMVAADVRARTRERFGGFSADRRLYQRLSEALYKFGRERPSREVLEAFLGKAVGPDGIVRELAELRR